MRVRTGLILLQDLGPIAGSCEYNKAAAGSVDDLEYLDKLNISFSAIILH
jgi:hypothetical protein